jgi:chloramphenicol 3-O-phosphotransferase
MKPGAHGHAIFINGIPSAGKSSVAAEIKRESSTFRVLTGDDVIRQVPYEQRAARAHRLFSLTLNTLERWLGPSNVVVDGAWTERQVIEAQERFGDMGLYVILRIDESERRRRESVRKDRRLGSKWDPSWHDVPGPDDLYDLVIDSKLRDVSECANIILTKAKQHWDDNVLF